MRDLLSNPVSGVAIAVLILAVILDRQLQKRPVREDSGFRGPLIMGLIGLVEAAAAAPAATPSVVVATVASLVLGAGLAYLRGRSVRLTSEGGVLLRQGTPTTVLLWLIAIASHFGVDALAGALSPTTTATHGSSFGSSTILIYLAVSLGIQKVVMLRRARVASEVLA